MTPANEPNDHNGVAREAERKALQRKRSIAIAVSLGLLAVLFYIATLVKVGGGLVGKAGS